MPDSTPNTQDLQQMAAQMIEDLRASGAVPGIAVGAAAPRFALASALGTVVSLDERLAAGPVVVMFYRGAWCPICNLHLAEMQAALPEIRSLGATLIAISGERPDDSLSLSERLELGFDVLSDPDQSVIRAYRLQFELPAAFRDVYRQMGMDLTTHNADQSWHLPVPATFVLDRAGIVRAAHVDPNYRERFSADAVLDALRALP